MKRFLALLCALLMCLTFAFTSCGDKNKNGGNNGDGTGDGGNGNGGQTGMDNPFGDLNVEDNTENDNVVEW